MSLTPTTFSTHVLDVVRGEPAGGVPVRLEVLVGADITVIGDRVTDADGRADLVSDDFVLAGGRYRLTFDTAAYGAVFYPQVVVVVDVADGSGHTHIPLLLSAFGYTTYRGS